VSIGSNAGAAGAVEEVLRLIADLEDSGQDAEHILAAVKERLQSIKTSADGGWY
jgi:hypothetical protein